GGASWKMVSSDTLIDQRPFYFSHVETDPKNPDVVYAMSQWMSRSTDGGSSFKKFALSSVADGDFHMLWIAPNDPSRMIDAADGGYDISLDGGSTWASGENLSIGEAYRVGLGRSNPYWVCAGFQDSYAWCAPSNSQDPNGIQNKAWIWAAGGDGTWAVPDPIDPTYVWADSNNASLTVSNIRTKDNWLADPYIQANGEAFDNRLAGVRYDWESPIAFAPWDGHIAWLGANRIFQSTDRGLHWEPISPDLTRDEKQHQAPPGGPVAHDVSGAEEYDAILDVEGSPLDRGEIWAGTDDGFVQLTRDSGAHWRNVTPPGGPRYGRYASIAPSPLVDGTAYTIEDGHLAGDPSPHVYFTQDFGEHWQSIVSGLPRDEWVRTIRPDIHNRNVVYLGTEQGVWISFDGGRSWQRFNDNLPAVSVRDIRMQPDFDDLVIATNGLGIYVIDDVTAIQELPAAVQHGTWLFQPRTSYEYNERTDEELLPPTEYAAANPPYGVTITYYLQSQQKHAPVIDIRDARGRTIRQITGPNDVGLNRLTWDFDAQGATKWYGAAPDFVGGDDGPTVPPGRYLIHMTLAGESYSRPAIVMPDPNTVETIAQFDESYAFSEHFTAELSAVDQMLNALDRARIDLTRASADAGRVHDLALATEVEDALGLREGLLSSLTGDFQNDEDFVQHPGQLREDLQQVSNWSTTIVTPAALAYGRRLEPRYVAAVSRYDHFVSATLPAVNAALAVARLQPLRIPQRIAEP
ncbi:MAG TPA: hypothetical protein VEJ20_02860, partial [Candidatus Eremiobacteraceae bacterium]|nr:hypothetical protein [Candidatus Eremiobacteraceae bacterium]